MTATTNLKEHRDRYEVELEVFKGPLDLLLHLIERRELDITLVSLTAVTDQYVEYVQQLMEPDPDDLANFLVVAARLLAIKALALVSKPAPQAAMVEEDGEDLVRSLREYQLYREAATMLRGWEAQQRRCYPRLVPASPPRAAALDGLFLDDLVNAICALSVTAPEDEPAPLPALPYTVADKVILIDALLVERSALYFHELYTPAASILEVVVTFLALLEMIKSGTVEALQSSVFGPIAVTRGQAEADALIGEDREMVAAIVT